MLKPFIYSRSFQWINWSGSQNLSEWFLYAS